MRRMKVFAVFLRQVRVILGWKRFYCYFSGQIYIIRLTFIRVYDWQCFKLIVEEQGQVLCDGWITVGSCLLCLVSCRIACQVSGGSSSFFQKESKRQCGTKTENVRPFESISVAEVKTQSCRTAAKFAKLFFSGQ